MSSGDVSRSAYSMVSGGPFARLWWASVIGSTGDWITIFATIALGDTIAGGTGVLLALISRILPGLLVGAWIGVIADRVDRRVLVVISDLGRGLTVPFLVFATSLPILVAISVMLELLSLVGQPPRNAILPSLVPRESLVTANSLMLGSTYGSAPIGAAFNWALSALPPVTLGGVVPALTGDLTLSFLVDGVTFFLSAALVASLPAVMTRPANHGTQGAGAEPVSAMADLLEGASFFWQRRSVRRVIVGMTTALVGGGTMIVLGKSFVENVLHADQTGFFAVVTTMGAGAGAGIAAVSMYESRLVRRDLVFAISLLTTGAGLAAAALTATVSGAALWMLVMGFGAGAAYVMGLTHLHEQVSDELRGRVFATLFALMRIGLFLSMALAAPLRALLSGVGFGRLSSPTRLVIFLGGAVIIFSGLATLWSLRGLFGRPKLGSEARDILARASEARRLRLPRRRGADTEDDKDGPR